MQERYGDLYTEDNVAISGTHTHSGPAGYLQYVLYQITSLGFVRQSWAALVDGAFQVSRNSIVMVGPCLAAHPVGVYVFWGRGGPQWASRVF